MDIEITTGFSRINCGACGVIFWIPDALHAERKEDKQTFYCPNGHPRAYHVSVSERLQQQLDLKEKEVARLKTDNIILGAGVKNRDRDLERLRKRVALLKKGAK